MLLLWLVLAVLGAYAWVVAGPVLLVIAFGVPAEAAAARWRRRRERRQAGG